MNRWLRRTRYAASPGAWAGVAEQLSWNVRCRLERQEERHLTALTWRLPRDARADVGVVWPRRYTAYARGWLEPIRRGIEHQVVVHVDDIPQEKGNLVVVLFRLGSTSWHVAVDYDDLSDLHPSVDRFPLYFKMQYRSEGYGSPNVVPGGYVCKNPALYTHVMRWRGLRARLGDRSDVFGRFGLAHGSEMRQRLLELMRGQTAFSFQGGETGTTWWEYAHGLCGAKVCLDVPGRGDLTYRLVECLGIGSCLVRPTLETKLHAPLEAGIHYAEVSPDLSDLVACCERLLVQPEERERLSTAAAQYFDRYLRLEQLGGYYLDQCLRVAAHR